MLKTNTQFMLEAHRVVDLFIAVLALTLAVAVRRYIVVFSPNLVPVFDFWPEAGWLYLLVVIGWGLLLRRFGYYEQRRFSSMSHLAWILLRVNLAVVMLAFVLFYLLRITNMPRIMILLMGVFGFLLMMAKEQVLSYYGKYWMKSANILLVGEPTKFASILSRFGEQDFAPAHILGYLCPQSGISDRTTRSELAYLGTTGDLQDIMHSENIDYVVLCPEHEHFDEVQDVICQCETEGVEVWLLANLFQAKIAKPMVDEFQGLPMLTFRTAPGSSWAFLTKRIIDLTGALILLTIFLPIMFLIAIFIRMETPGPVFFIQERCTIRGRLFPMIKFRTMDCNAEDSRESLSGQNEMSGPVFKINGDPRITRVGVFLRRHSLDELPQLWNVLLGQMSLVGPRPPIPSEVQEYENWQRRRFSMPAGITGLWQVSGRNRTGFDEWMRMDLKYIDEWSLWLDVRILVKTVGAVIKGTGC